VLEKPLVGFFSLLFVHAAFCRIGMGKVVLGIFHGKVGFETLKNVPG